MKDGARHGVVHLEMKPFGAIEDRGAQQIVVGDDRVEGALERLRIQEPLHAMDDNQARGGVRRIQLIVQPEPLMDWRG